jgi:large subunit ribosomal protein L30e
MDLAHALKVALSTGKVKVGLAETLASVQEKRAKLVIVSSSCPDEKLKSEKKVGNVPIYHYEGNALELGAACGKPFPISSLAVLDPGSSALLSLETG